MAKPPTVQSVAKLARVSRQTVSNVINAPKKVRPETRTRVEAAIAELGYIPNLGARRLRTRKSSTIAVRLDPYAGGISGVVLDRFIHALTEQATRNNRRILVYAATDFDNELKQIAGLIDSQEIDSIVLTGTSPEDPRPRWLSERHLPFVAFGRPWGKHDFDRPPHPWVDVNGAAGTRQATAHAIDHFGETVAFLGWPYGSATGDDRARGWQQAIVDATGTLPDQTLRWACEEDPLKARRLVTDFFQQSAVTPTAIVCASDSLAVGVRFALAELGIEDLGVYGFDNSPIAQALGFSSVEQQPELVAEAVLSHLLGPESTPTGTDNLPVLVEPTLVVR